MKLGICPHSPAGNILYRWVYLVFHEPVIHLRNLRTGAIHRYFGWWLYPGDAFVVILEPAPNNVRQTKKLMQDLFDLGIGAGRIRIALINRIRSSVQMNWTQVQEELGYKIATVFTPAPELAYQAAAANQPMVMQQPGSITAQQFEKLAALITKQQ